ncbi:MAG: hypothetical protein KBD76_01285 [Bacteriovorax sp.]|jgi:3D (Asp-Asp-Asp) domain-containing protein|nr:hypothetical protein [Bacteriovorax sp.]
MNFRNLNLKQGRPTLLVGLVFFTIAHSIFFSAFAQSDLAIDQYLEAEKFNFAEAPIAELGEPIVLWATNYHLPEIINGTGDVPLRDISGVELGPTLTLADWCKSALEGSVRIIFNDGNIETYNYHTTSEYFPNDCSAYYAFKLGKTKFRKARGPFGDGVGDFRLAPYRTVATDPTLIPTGSVLFIPEARGVLINLPSGQSIVHDGYFFAGDVGGAIKLNHIDVFIGTHTDSSFFPWIGNMKTKTFNAFLVKDQVIIDSLTQLHLK